MLPCILLLAGTTGCTAYFRDGPSKCSPAYRYHPYHYHYYPGPDVYYHIESGFYYYPEGDHWQHARALPSGYHLGRHDRIPLWIAQAVPYAGHETHREKYSPGAGRSTTDSREDEKERDFNRRMHRRYHAR